MSQTPNLDRLPTLAARQAKAQPKPRSLAVEAVESDREDARKLEAMRRVVWDRDKGQCQNCERKVRRMLARHVNRGEVHHVRGRNVAPEDRYNPATAILLCMLCHDQVQRHELVIERIRGRFLISREKP